MPIYCQYEGIKGAATEKGHKDWIELESCQLGVHRQMTSAAGRGSNREASQPSVSEIVVTKTQDCASADLFRAACSGQGKKVKIDFVKTDKDKLETYLTIEMENTMISSYSTSGHGGDGHSRPMESLSFNFTKITYTNHMTDSVNKNAGKHQAFWDLATQTGG
jgi:type VI secretion system secreted protein Hcp